MEEEAREGLDGGRMGSQERMPGEPRETANFKVRRSSTSLGHQLELCSWSLCYLVWSD